MSTHPDQPLSRRAARESRQATGEQPSLPPVDAAEPLGQSGSTQAMEDTSTTSAPILGPDGQPLTRRRLRELRETGLVPTVTPASEPVPAQPAAEPPRSAFAPKPAPRAASSWSAPAGHWTRQLEVEDELETTVSREVGASTSTASMLVVNELPKVVDLGGPLGETGEVLLTGSISLSPDFAATGAIRSMHADAHHDDRFDGPAPTTDSTITPIRASAAASQHALGTPIIAGRQPKTSRALTILLVTASVLAVLVTGLVVTAVILRWI